MEILIAVLVLLVVTRIFGEIFTRFGQPALVGELISGITLGVILKGSSDSPLLEYYTKPGLPIIFHLGEDPVFIALTDLGIFFLTLYAGIEIRARDLAKTSIKAFWVAFAGMIVPLVSGYVLGVIFLPESDLKVAQSLCIGTALAITAVPVTMRVLMDLKKLHSETGKMIVSAAIFDDVLSLALLAVFVAVAQEGSVPNVFWFIQIALKTSLFFLLTIIVGRFVFPFVGKHLGKLQTAEFEFTALVIAALSFSVLADYLDLHFILGAFVAGLFFEAGTAGKNIYKDVQRKVSAITMGFFAPLFFASIGLHLDLASVSAVPGFLLILILLAFFSKLAGAGLPAYWLGFSRRESLAIGIAMSGRGAIELIVLEIALRAGVFSMPDPAPPIISTLYSSLVLVAIVTTIVVPIVLKPVVKQEIR